MNKFLDAAFNHLDSKNIPLFTVDVLTLTSFFYSRHQNDEKRHLKFIRTNTVSYIHQFCLTKHERKIIH
jgi:hypothetical protein